VATLRRAQPHIGPGRGHGKLVEPRDLLAVGDAVAVGIEIGERLAAPLPADARLLVAGIEQTGGLGAGARFGDRIRCGDLGR
jgi:hypothetical protein